MLAHVDCAKRMCQMWDFVDAIISSSFISFHFFFVHFICKIYGFLNFVLIVSIDTK